MPYGLPLIFMDVACLSVGLVLIRSIFASLHVCSLPD